jgi:pyruvate-ferredoxin/flavodoxin oxidoreductase
MIIANATGCTSIYGGSSPTCTYTPDKHGAGPAWANSLFEDNAEFGFGIKQAKEIQGEDASVWIIGGDGWAYDIGFGGLDHVVAQNLDVNILILDTQVYSNTGGQSSKSTPAGAIAKFASGGKATQSKDLAGMLLNYENVYVAQIAMGANYTQTLSAIKEAEAHKGPSVVIAYATCINHGIDMSNGMKVMKNAVESGYWTLFRRAPAVDGKPAKFTLDSFEPKLSYADFVANETRFKALERANPEEAKKLFASAEQYARRRFEKYKALATK